MIQALDIPVSEGDFENLLEAEFRPDRRRNVACRLEDVVALQVHVRHYSHPVILCSLGGRKRRFVPCVDLSIGPRQAYWPQEQSALPCHCGYQQARTKCRLTDAAGAAVDALWHLVEDDEPSIRLAASKALLDSLVKVQNASPKQTTKMRYSVEETCE